MNSTAGARRILLTAIMAIICACATAQTVRPVTATWTAEIGSAHEADTYLSPLTRSGIGAALAYERWQAMRFSPELWTMRLRLGIDMSHTCIASGGSPMWSLGISGDWSMMWRTSPASRLTLYLGPMVKARMGCLYLKRNGNNPVQARAELTAGIAAAATWSQRIGRLPVTFGLQPSLLLLGAFFMPDFGELYYEIGLGNRAGLARFAWPASWRSVQCLASADLHLGNTTLRLGYRFALTSASASHITSRSITHAAVIGIGGKWMSLAPHSALTPHARIISAYY